MRSPTFMDSTLSTMSLMAVNKKIRNLNNAYLLQDKTVANLKRQKLETDVNCKRVVIVAVGAILQVDPKHGIRIRCGIETNKPLKYITQYSFYRCFSVKFIF